MNHNIAMAMDDGSFFCFVILLFVLLSSISERFKPYKKYHCRINYMTILIQYYNVSLFVCGINGLIIDCSIDKLPGCGKHFYKSSGSLGGYYSISAGFECDCQSTKADHDG
uniref:Uncharacterized protein n=1 Tax=Glossina austeni TaxID=7395 RepID=A0A1A9VL05_GLOAU